MTRASNYLLTFLLVFLFSCEKNQSLELTLSETIPDETIELRSIASRTFKERVVVANRVSRSVSIIDAATNTLLETIPMPDNGEPMYVVHVPTAKAFFVGDRANNRVVAFDEVDYSYKGSVPAGAGVFHMWGSRNGRQLWVNNDIDKTTTIINPTTMSVVGTAATPADLVALGGKPHDVFIDITGNAYVSVLGVEGANDYIIKYDARSFAEVGRAAVGQDPHLAASIRDNSLFVPCQNSNAVYVLDRFTMDVTKIIPLDGAHGAAMGNLGRYFYSADISGSRLATIDTRTKEIVDRPLSLRVPTAHNLAVNARDTKLFVTHSGGTADQLTIYDLSPTPSPVTSITIGLNPFGLVYYRY